jgi:hypothetical protein
MKNRRQGSMPAVLQESVMKQLKIKAVAGLKKDATTNPRCDALQAQANAENGRMLQATTGPVALGMSTVIKQVQVQLELQFVWPEEGGRRHD